jgi:predicted Zn-dependent protease
LHYDEGMSIRLSFAAALVLPVALVTAQTQISAPENRFSPEDDVRLGQDAEAEVRRTLPIMNDGEVTSYVARLGRRLVAEIPGALDHPEFDYSFDAVNVRDLNAFALPGGPTFVNRGMIEAARNEGEVAGVVAHEISHVALRHGTAQASKATKYQIGELAGAVLGAIIGGRAGDIVAQGTSFGLGTAFLRFGRDFERQADLLGAQIMANAGYDPMDMANMFRTIEERGGSGGPEWLSSHPNPGNRYEAIAREAASLNVEDPIHTTPEFSRVRKRLNGMRPAPTTEQVVRSRGGSR